MQGVVEYYQLIEAQEPVIVNTLPNGRVDAWINIDGSFGFIDNQSGAFNMAPDNGFFPLTNDVSVIQIRKSLLCLNLKFLPHLLAFPSMKKLQASKESVSFEDLFEKSFVWNEGKQSRILKA